MNWGALKGLIFEDTDKTTNTKKEKNEKVSESSTKSTSTPLPPVISTPPGNGVIDENIIKSLKKAIDSANLDGFDYLEYTKILEQLASTIPSEQMRYQAAFASAIAMGTNKEKLISTAKHYIDTLTAEKANFDVLLEEQTQTTIINRESEISAIDDSIKEKSAAIQKITNEINELSNNRRTILDEVTQNKIKIGKVQNDFVSCLKIFLNKIVIEIYYQN